MRLLLAAVLLALAGRAQGANDFSREAIGTSGAEFLTMDVGARGIALGGAYTALTNDVYSLYWNPAGLTKIPRLSLGFQYTRYIEEISYQSLMWGQRINDNSVVAVGVRYQDFGDVTQTDINDRDVGQFRPRNYLAEIGWGQSVYDLSDSEVDIDVGVAARYLHSDIFEKANAFSSDIGLQSRFYRGTRFYDLAFVVQNLGRGTKYDQVRDSLPARFKMGGALSPVRNLTLSVDGILPFNNLPYAAGGVEYVIDAGQAAKLALRGGVNTLTKDSLETKSIMNLGMGVTVTDFTFDYAFSPMGELGTVHRFSVSYNLPAKLSRRHRER